MISSNRNKVRVSPKYKTINTVVTVPGSKSIANRALIIASLARGRSILRNIPECDDVLLMIKALKDLGIKIKKREDNTLFIPGTAGVLKTPKHPLYVNNAGTTMRFLCSFVTFAKGKVILRGDGRMSERPIDDLLYSMRQMNIEANKHGADIEIKSKGSFPGGAINISGRKSSQFISSLLMCGPYGKDNLTLKIMDKLVSMPYLALTLKMMSDFGASFDMSNNYKKIFVSNKRRYAPREYVIEGDCSAASYFWAAAAITCGKAKVTNINPKTKQGDIGFVKILERMGCRVRYGDDFVEVCGKELRGINVDMNRMPDAVPTLAIVALFAKGRTLIRNIAHLRDKESDRIGQFCQELAKTGAKIQPLKNGLIVEDSVKFLHSAALDTHNDHRLAMSFSLLGLKAPIEIMNPMCVKKSFPDFFDRFRDFGEVA